MTATIVPGCGPLPCKWMIVGEAPGVEEASQGKPFVGKSGIEQRWYMSRHRLSPHQFYLTNVSKIYHGDNRDPSPADIAEWTPVLLSEVQDCAPRLIIAVGRFAAQFFLGNDATMDLTHGIPHRPGAFDSSRVSRAPKGCIIIPVTHPASVFHGSDDKKNDIRALVDWDYAQAARVLALIKAGREHEVKYPIDEYPTVQYEDVSGCALSDYLGFYQPSTIAIDTEGIPGAEWSIQTCITPGMAHLLRCSRADFHLGIAAIQHVVNSGAIVVTHDASTPAGCCYDTIMCRGMGLDLSRAHRIFNTMTALYLLRFEPQGLKPAAWRWCGMQMTDYMSLIGDIGYRKQFEYLCRVLDYHDTPWPTIEPRIVDSHDGTSRVYSPHGVEQSARSIVLDIANRKLDKDGNPPDPWKRWKQVLPEIRSVVGKVLGPMPTGTLEDIPLPDAVAYSCADADGTLRLAYALMDELRRRDLMQ